MDVAKVLGVCKVEAYVILRSTMASRAAAAVEIAVLAGAGAAHAALSVTADVDVGNAGGVGI